jgi:hypothetical protein
MSERDRLAKLERVRVAQLVEDATNVMRQQGGRRFVRQILDAGREGFPSYTRGDALGTAYNEGRRSMAIELMDLLDEHCPKLVDLMQSEARVAKATARATERRERQEADGGASDSSHDVQ